jgi:hypothetical protein
MSPIFVSVKRPRFRAFSSVPDQREMPYRCDVAGSNFSLRGIDVLSRLISDHGAPTFLRSDNGARFCKPGDPELACRDQDRNRFDRFGQTVAESTDESFNGKFRDECLSMVVPQPTDFDTESHHWRSTSRVGLSCSNAAALPCMGRIRLLWAGVALLVAALASGAVDALGLDEIAQQSALGDPLRVVIPVITGAGDDAVNTNLMDECFKLVGPDGDRSSDLPQILNGRLALMHSSSGLSLVVSTSRPINDPALSITVQAGCTASIRRQYTLLLDPPAIQAPVAESVAPTQADLSANGTTETAVPTAPVPSAETPGRRIASAASSGPTVARRKPAKRATGPTVAQVKPPAPAPAPAAAAASQQLQVSRGMDGLAGGPNASSPIRSGAGAPPSIEEVEVETVVLQRRIAELSDMVQRMQQDLRAAQAARDAAEAAAKAAPLAVLERWAGTDWPWFAALIVLVSLWIAMRFSRLTARRSGPVTPLDIDSFAPMLVPESAIAPAPPRSVPATPRTGPPGSEFSDHLDLAFEEDLMRNGKR